MPNASGAVWREFFSKRLGKGSIARTSSRVKTVKVCGWATIGRPMKFSSERFQVSFGLTLTGAGARTRDGTRT